jgi:hypothetical protein
VRLLDEDRGFFTTGALRRREELVKFVAKFFAAILWTMYAVMPISLPAQSLAEAARKESERRRILEERGISGRVIEQQDTTQLGLNGSLSVFAPVPASRPAEKPAVAIERGAPNSFRKALQNLDHEIRQGEDRLILLKEKITTARRAPPVLTRSSRSNSRALSTNRLQDDVREWELKLKRLRQDRLDTYTAGRKAGFLPGELDWK